jgi:hypothetical protein
LGGIVLDRIILGGMVFIGVNLSQNAYSEKVSLKASESKSRLKKEG